MIHKSAFLGRNLEVKICELEEITFYLKPGVWMRSPREECRKKRGLYTKPGDLPGLETGKMRRGG